MKKQKNKRTVARPFRHRPNTVCWRSFLWEIVSFFSSSFFSARPTILAAMFTRNNANRRGLRVRTRSRALQTEGLFIYFTPTQKEKHPKCAVVDLGRAKTMYLFNGHINNATGVELKDNEYYLFRTLSGVKRGSVLF